MKRCYPNVDKRSRSKMVAFLANHFRYDTMSSWNASTSYACNIKIHKLGLDNDMAGRLYNLLDVDEFHWRMSDLLRSFDEQHGYCWQAGINGRSGGYVVLYEGGMEPSGYKSYCSSCGGPNYRKASALNACGRCDKDSMQDYPSTHMRTVTYAGRSVDMYEDFEDWTLGELRDRVELVQSLDALADAMVDEALWLAENHTIEDETYLVEKTRKVLVSCAA